MSQISIFADPLCAQRRNGGNGAPLAKTLHIAVVFPGPASACCSGRAAPLSLPKITYLFSGKHSITPGAQHLVVCTQTPALTANDNCVMPKYIILTCAVMLAVDHFIIRFEACAADSRRAQVGEASGLFPQLPGPRRSADGVAATLMTPPARKWQSSARRQFREMTFSHVRRGVCTTPHPFNGSPGAQRWTNPSGGGRPAPRVKPEARA